MVDVLPTEATRSITVQQLPVGSTLTISAPSSVNQGASFVISGILIRNDTGGPVPSATISLSFNGSPLGSAITGIDGDYLRTVTIPSYGNFTLKASFAGMSGLDGSEAIKGISVGGLPFSYALLIPFSLGVISLYLLTKFGGK